MFVDPADMATISGGDLPSVELAGDGVEALMAGRLVFANDRYDVGRILCHLRLTGRAHAPQAVLLQSAIL